MQQHLEVLMTNNVKIKVIIGKYGTLEIKNKPEGYLAYASYEPSTQEIRLDGEFNLEELEAIVEFMKEQNAPSSD